MNRAHDCAQYYHSDLNTNEFLILYRNQVRFVPGFVLGINISEAWYWWPFFEFMAYSWSLCFVTNKYSSCFGRNILTDPDLDFSCLWALIVGLYAVQQLLGFQVWGMSLIWEMYLSPKIFHPSTKIWQTWSQTNFYLLESTWLINVYNVYNACLHWNVWCLHCHGTEATGSVTCDVQR